MSLRPLMFFKPLAFFENPSRGGLHLDGGPSEDITPRADLFSGGVGEKKNVTEWVKNGETTAEAKALADSLHAQMEAIKRETNLQLVQEYRFVFDNYILSKESYDSKPTPVDSTYKNKGALYVLEKSCPILTAQFKAYPDLRYLAYANATKQVPDVDVLPIGSTVSMVDGRVLLQRPGKPDASFMIFPWDYRAEIEKKYEELKPAPKPEPAPEAPPSGTGPSQAPFEPDSEGEGRKDAGSEGPKDDPDEVEPKLYEEGRDANLRTEWEQDVKPALMALEQTYPGVTVRIRDASFVPAKDKPKAEVDRWPNYGKHGKTVELVGENGHTERFQILVPRKAESYFDDKVTLARDKDPNMGVTWETVQNGAGLTEFFVREAEDLFAEEKLSELLPADIRALNELPPDRQIHYFSDLVLQNLEFVLKDPKTRTEQDRKALSQLYYGGLLENMTAWHQELSARTDLTPAMKDNLQSIETHLTVFIKKRSIPVAPEAPAEPKAPTSAQPEKPERTIDPAAYQTSLAADASGDAQTALAGFKELQRLGSQEADLAQKIERLQKQFGRVSLEGDASGCSWQFSPLAEGLDVAEYKPYMDFALRELQSKGSFDGLLPLGEYTLIKPGYKVSPRFTVKDKMPTKVEW